jgi:hypothetical protein
VDNRKYGFDACVVQGELEVKSGEFRRALLDEALARCKSVASFRTTSARALVS